MTKRTAEIVICGAGIAGIAVAYHLSVKQGVKGVLLVDERPPLSLTSDKSTEAYRNWWQGPGDGMIALMNRSIDIFEELARESGNRFNLNRRGYVYATANPDHVAKLKSAAIAISKLGAGPIRYHSGDANQPAYIPSPPEGYLSLPQGADLITSTDLIHKHFPYLSEETVAVLHARRCGWLSAQQLGIYMLECARDHGTRLLRARVEGLDIVEGRVEAVRLGNNDVVKLVTSRFVIAAGPFQGQVANMMGLEIPVYHELHEKVAFNDHQKVLPREAPLLVWIDSQNLEWSDEERLFLAESEDTRALLERFPPGVHLRPEGMGESTTLLMLWNYHTQHRQPVFPIKHDPDYPEVLLRGMATMLPGLRVYFHRAPRPQVDGGYYTKTRENRPLIGPLPVEGAFLIGALSGFGVMASAAAGELLAAYITGRELPKFAQAFSLERYQDPCYLELLAKLDRSADIEL